MIKLFKKPWDNRQGYKLVDASGATYDMGAVESYYNKDKYEIVDEIEKAVTTDTYVSPKESAAKARLQKIINEAGGNTQARRMAGEDKLIQDAIKHLEGDVALDSAMQDAEEYLTMRRPELDAFKKEGQSYGDAEAELLSLDTLRGNVPAPVVRKYGPGEEDRLHTRYQTNAVTRQQEVAPFIDTETGDVLVTELGKLNINPGQAGRGGSDDTASELVALNALKLMDEGPAKMNRQRKLVERYGKKRMADMHHYADAKQGDTNVEMMISQRGPRTNNTVAIPTYTNLVPLGNTDIKQEVLKLKSQGLSTEQAVESLIANGRVQDTRETRWGKLGRSDINNVAGDADAVYDELLVSGYPQEQMRNDREFKSHKLAAAPVSLHMVDLPGMRGAINRGEVDTRTIMTANKGFDGKGHDRTKVQEIIPQNNQYVTDLTTSHPFTQQLLRTLPVI